MSKFKKEKGIIYRIYDSGVKDKIINLINEKGEKITILAKGVKSANSRKSHSIEVGNLVECKIILGYSIPVLTGIKTLNEFSHWKKDFKNIYFLQMMCEVYNHFIVEEHGESSNFEIFEAVLNKDSQNKIFLIAILILKIMNESGMIPSLDSCLETGNKLEQDKIFKAVGSPGYTSMGGTKMDFRIVKVQNFACKSNISDVLKINLSEGESIKMLKLHVSWVEQVIERELKSKKILYSVLK